MAAAIATHRSGVPLLAQIFTAFNHRGGEVMGVRLETGEIRDYSQSPWLDEADGVFPDGRSRLVTRELARVFIPRDLDLWRRTLDGGAHRRRLTRFNRYQGYGVSNGEKSGFGHGGAQPEERAVRRVAKPRFLVPE